MSTMSTDPVTYRGFFSTSHSPLQFWPTEWIVILIVSIIFFFLLHPVTSYILNNFETFRAFDEKKKRDWVSRWISTLHAIIFTGLSFYVLFISGEVFNDIWAGSVDTSCPVIYPTLVFSCGYFIVDLIMCLFHYFDWGTVIHHTSATFIAFTILSWQRGAFFMIWFGLTEASTPFVNNRVFLADLDMKDSMLYVVNGFLMWLGFLIFRLPMIICIPYYIIRYSWYYFLHQAPYFHFLAAFLSYGLISLLNVHWFILITKGLLKAVNTRNTPPAKEKAATPKTHRAKTKKED